MHHERATWVSTDELARAAATFVAESAQVAVDDHGNFLFAVSGGTTPWAMFEHLLTLRVPWERVTLYQVDERVAPDGDPARNLTQLRHSLGAAQPRVVAMDVTDADLDAAADRYAAELPDQFDLIHLGLGPDGHTASLVPGDPVLDVTDRCVAVTAPYQGHRRVTLTYPALSRTHQLLWLVAGSDKRTALAELLSGSDAIPAGRVEAPRSLVMTDAAAVA